MLASGVGLISIIAQPPSYFTEQGTFMPVKSKNYIMFKDQVCIQRCRLAQKMKMTLTLQMVLSIQL
jgi:hypothetical protein